MGFLARVLNSSIGKKQLVAVTGLLLVGFLFTHLAGNLLMLKSAEAFNDYSAYLLSHPLILAAEIGLAGLFLAHVVWGLRVSWENRRARPVRYELHAAAGGRTWGSATMKYTGLFTLVFLLIHVYTFRLSHPEDMELFDWVIYNFQKPWYMGFYVLAMLFLGLHLSHGFKSAFHTLGVNHPKYTPWINAAGVAIAALLTAGFGMLPVWGFLR